MQTKKFHHTSPLILLVLIVSLFPSVSFCATLPEEIDTIRTPEDLTIWLSHDFKYVMEMPDAWQTPQETVSLKTGDCEDFAILASAVLSHLGIENELIIINFRNLKLGHAVCTWKDKDGFYRFISNRELIKTAKCKIEEAIGQIYPDWERILFTNQQKKYLRVIKRIREKEGV